MHHFWAQRLTILCLITEVLEVVSIYQDGKIFLTQSRITVAMLMNALGQHHHSCKCSWKQRLPSQAGWDAWFNCLAEVSRRLVRNRTQEVPKAKDCKTDMTPVLLTWALEVCSSSTWTDFPLWRGYKTETKVLQVSGHIDVPTSTLEGGSLPGVMGFWGILK